jgi:predicted helicase
VAISLFVKKKGIEKKILHSDFWGTRLEKYKRSLEDDLKNVDWEILSPTKPHYLFVSQNIKLRSKYEKGIPLNKIFVKNTLAVVTGKDDLFVDFDDKALISKLKLAYPNDKIEASKIKPIAYRIFDTRFIYYDNKFLERPRIEIMQNLFSGNIALNSAKYGRQLGSFNYFVTQNITSKDLTSSIDSVNTFPLYIISSDLSREVNFSSDFKKTISDFQKSVSNEDILGYIYAILYSPTYRSKYSEFLKIDFPRIPFAEDKKAFKKLAELGNELINVHLLQETELNYSFGEFLGKGDSIVEKPNYVMEKKIGKLYINKTQYFNNVPQQVYDFYIGGYQVFDKYLKERKERALSYEEATNVEKMIKAIAFTIDQMAKIDKQTQNWI